MKKNSYLLALLFCTAGSVTQVQGGGRGDIELGAFQEAGNSGDISGEHRDDPEKPVQALKPRTWRDTLNDLGKKIRNSWKALTKKFSRTPHITPKPSDKNPMPADNSGEDLTKQEKKDLQHLDAAIFKVNKYNPDKITPGERSALMQQKDFKQVGEVSRSVERALDENGFKQFENGEYEITNSIIDAAYLNFRHTRTNLILSIVRKQNNQEISLKLENLRAWKDTILKELRELKERPKLREKIEKEKKKRYKQAEKSQKKLPQEPFTTYRERILKEVSRVVPLSQAGRDQLLTFMNDKQNDQGLMLENSVGQLVRSLVQRSNEKILEAANNITKTDENERALDALNANVFALRTRKGQERALSLKSVLQFQAKIIALAKSLEINVEPIE